MQNFMNNEKIKKYLWVSIPFVFIAILLVVILFIVNTSRDATQKLGSLHVDGPVKGSQFIINGQVYYIPVTIENLLPGKYTITAHNEGYIDESQTITIVAGQKATVSLEMKQGETEEEISDEEKKWLPYFDSESEKINNEIAKREQKYPLTKELPEVIGPVMLDYDVDADGTVHYIVRPLPGQTYKRANYEPHVNAFIESKGIDPKTLEITWQ
jgi:hypothetical protein